MAGWLGPLPRSTAPIYALPATAPLAFADGSALARCSGSRPMLWLSPDALARLVFAAVPAADAPATTADAAHLL